MVLIVKIKLIQIYAARLIAVRAIAASGNITVSVVSASASIRFPCQFIVLFRAVFAPQSPHVQTLKRTVAFGPT